MSVCWCENPVHLGNRSSVQRHDMGRMGRGEKTTAVASLANISDHTFCVAIEPVSWYIIQLWHCRSVADIAYLTWQLRTWKHSQHKLPWVLLGVLNEMNKYISFIVRTTVTIQSTPSSDEHLLKCQQFAFQWDAAC